MKNILFDLISSQGMINGGAEYTKRIFLELTKMTSNFDVLVDSNMTIDEEIVSILRSNEIRIIDINQIDLILLLNEKFDKFIICILQRYNKYDFSSVDIGMIVVWHDIRGLDLGKINYTDYLKGGTEISRRMRSFLKRIVIKSGLMFKVELKKYNILKAMLVKETTQIITDSEYSKYSIKYFFPEMNTERIHILYPPQKEVKLLEYIENRKLQKLIDQKKRYVMLISCHRPDKNYEIMSRVMDRILNEDKDIYFLLVGPANHSDNSRILNIRFLSASDLEHAYKNAYIFVYPSLSEGFGYPPLEAMKYGIPVLASNCSSIPEVLASAPVYFSPFYENDLYYGYVKICKDWNKHSKESKKHYNLMIEKQKKDIKKFLEIGLK